MSDKALDIMARAVMWIVGAICAVVAAMAFVRMPDGLQISASILVAGGFIAAAIWFKGPGATLNVYGNDWRVTDLAEDKP